MHCFQQLREHRVICLQVNKNQRKKMFQCNSLVLASFRLSENNFSLLFVFAEFHLLALKSCWFSSFPVSSGFCRIRLNLYESQENKRTRNARAKENINRSNTRKWDALILCFVALKYETWECDAHYLFTVISTKPKRRSEASIVLASLHIVFVWTFCRFIYFRLREPQLAKPKSSWRMAYDKCRESTESKRQKQKTKL